MLRVHPIHYTSRVEEFLPIFDALGLTRRNSTENTYQFDAGSGRLTLRQVPVGSKKDGVTQLGFEVRDLEVFASRTVADGSAAEIVRREQQTSVEVRGRDGLSFFVNTAEPLESDPAADGRLSVNMLWLTPDVPAAITDLSNIGARLLKTADNGHIADFAAKNGGKIMAHFAKTAAHGPLGFGYHGKVEELLERLLAADINAHLIDESYGRTLHVTNPDFADLPSNPTGPTIWVNEEDQPDQYGYTAPSSTAPQAARLVRDSN